MSKSKTDTTDYPNRWEENGYSIPWAIVSATNFSILQQKSVVPRIQRKWLGIEKHHYMSGQG